jgi:outer membrane receptor protein involved in Fe transport
MFATKCKKLLSLVALVAFLAPVNLFAGTNGKITGVVKDKETGDPLPGVNIILEGTTMGAATNSKGEFTMINVPAGVYTVSTSMIGYAKVTKQNVRVLPDFTTRLDFDLTATSLGGEEVVVIAERPLIQKDQTMTMTVTSSEEIKNLPVRGFQSVANLGVGIVVNNTRDLEGGTGNVNVRGGRANETGVIIDGFLQNNLVTGTSTTQIPAGAVEEVVVITGGFDAEFGRNKSGIIQVTSKSGGTRYSGNVEYVNDRPMFAIDKGSYYGYDVISGGIGGPLIPGNNKIKFFISAEGRDIAEAEPSVFGHPVVTLSDAGIRGSGPGVLDTAIFSTDADGNVKFKDGKRPRSSVTDVGVNSDRGVNFQGKMTFDVIANKLRLDLSGNYGQTYRRSYITERVLSNDLMLKRDIQTYNIGLVATYTVNQTSFFDVGVNYFDTDRKLYNDAFGFNISNYQNKIKGNTGFATYYNDNLLRDINRGSLNFTRDRDTYIAFKTNYVNQVDKHNQIKAGVDFFRHTVRFLNMRDVDNPVLGANDNIGYQVVGTPGNYRIKEVNSDDLENKILGPTNPISFAAFVQDKLEYEGLVLRAGIRYDLFNAGVKRVKNLTDPTGQQDPGQALVWTDLQDPNTGDPANGLFDRGWETATAGYIDKNGNGNFDSGTDRLLAGKLGPEDYRSSKNDHKISPRLSVSFPVSEKTQFRMSYGKFFQQPNLNDLYVSPDFLERTSLAPPFAVAIGNPNLKAEQSTQYEVGLRRALSDRVAIDLSAFYSDTKGLINSQDITSFPSGLILKLNEDEAVSKGMTMALEIRRTGKFQGRVSYTLSSATGSGSAENSGFRSSWLGFADTKFNAPLAFDQRHTFVGNIDIRNSKGEGPSIGGQHLLENAGVNFQVNAASGLPYTPQTIVPVQVAGVPSGRVTARRNSQNQPWTFRVDMRADKTINIRENMNVNVYVWILNLLDRKNVIDVFPATGQADDGGYLATEAAATLTTREIQQYQVNYAEGLNYDTPRQVRLGIAFNF